VKGLVVFIMTSKLIDFALALLRKKEVLPASSAVSSKITVPE